MKLNLLLDDHQLLFLVVGLRGITIMRLRVLVLDLVMHSGDGDIMVGEHWDKMMFRVNHHQFKYLVIGIKRLVNLVVTGGQLGLFKVMVHYGCGDGTQ